MTGVIERSEAREVLRAGGVVAVATDTVYGVAASLATPGSIEKLFSLKRRPPSVALPVLVDSLESIEKLGVNWSTRARRLSEVFWPGALTIVVPVPHELAALVGSADDTVGFRVPGDEDLRALLKESGPLAVSSANEHGESPCQSVDDVLRAFGDREEFGGVLDGGVRSGDVSTVVLLEESSWRVLRSGAVSTSELAPYLN
jgi:L-threonylcarbamoyladenylate synthase